MPKIRLPDGAVKPFDAPVTVAEARRVDRPGLAKAALAGKVDGKVVDTSHVHRPRRRRRDRHRARTPKASTSSATRRRTCSPMR